MPITHHDEDRIVFRSDDDKIWLKIENDEFGYMVEIYGRGFVSSFKISKKETRELVDFLRHIKLPKDIQP